LKSKREKTGFATHVAKGERRRRAQQKKENHRQDAKTNTREIVMKTKAEIMLLQKRIRRLVRNIKLLASALSSEEKESCNREEEKKF
jgi:HAMP domain-containing protein